MLLIQFISRLFHKKEQCSVHCPEKFLQTYSTTDSVVSVDVKRPPQDPPLCSGPLSPQQGPHAIYDGGFPDSSRRGIYLRIANGGAGQAGLIKAWADAFIRHMVAHGTEPFKVIQILSFCSTRISDPPICRLHGIWETLQTVSQCLNLVQLISR